MTRKELFIRLMEAALSGVAVSDRDNTPTPSMIANNACDIAVASIAELEKRFRKETLYDEREKHRDYSL